MQGRPECLEGRAKMASAIATVAGAIIAGIVGILAVGFQQRIARQHQQETAQVQRLSEFSAAGWAASLTIIKLSESPSSRKTDTESSDAYQGAIDRFNSVLAQIQLLDAGEVYQAAHRVNECLVHLGREARGRRINLAAWQSSRADLSDAVALYQQAARRALGAPAIEGNEPWRSHDLGTKAASVAHQQGTP